MLQYNLNTNNEKLWKHNNQLRRFLKWRCLLPNSVRVNKILSDICQLTVTAIIYPDHRVAWYNQAICRKLQRKKKELKQRQPEESFNKPLRLLDGLWNILLVNLPTVSLVVKGCSVLLKSNNQRQMVILLNSRSKLIDECPKHLGHVL